MRTKLLALVPIMSAMAIFSAAAQEASIPKQTLDDALRARLPETIQTAGSLTSANSGSFPPYRTVLADKTIVGASADISTAVGELLGIEIKRVTINGLAGVLSGISSGRYDLAFGPIGDFPSRRKGNDFVDWVQEYVVFAVQKGNPTKIASIASTCGLRIAVSTGGSAEKVIKEQSEKCKAEGKPEVRVQSFPDEPATHLALLSKRTDGVFSSMAPLSHLVSTSKGKIELAGVKEENGFKNLLQAAVVPKGSPLTEILRDAINVLIKNGTYAKVMSKWGLEGNMVKEASINQGG